MKSVVHILCLIFILILGQEKSTAQVNIVTELNYDLNGRVVNSISQKDTLTYMYDPTGNRVNYQVTAYCSRIVKSEVDNVYGSLRRTIECLLPNDTVLFEQSLDLSALQVDGQIDLEKNLYFKQLITSQMTVQSTHGDTLFYILPQVDITWENMDVISNSQSPTLVNDGNLILDNSKVTNTSGIQIINNDSLVIKRIVEIKD